MKVRLPSNEKLVRFACFLALLALPLMVWSVFDPRVWPVLAALSIGQGIGTLSFLLFLVAVARDLGLKRKLAAEAAAAAAADAKAPPSSGE